MKGSLSLTFSLFLTPSLSLSLALLLSRSLALSHSRSLALSLFVSSQPRCNRVKHPDFNLNDDHDDDDDTKDGMDVCFLLALARSLSLPLSRSLSLAPSLSLPLSRCLIAISRDAPVDCQKSCRVDIRPTMGSRFLSLTFSHARTRALSHSLTVPLSRSLALFTTKTAEVEKLSTRAARASQWAMAVTRARMLGTCRHTRGNRFLINSLANLKEGSV